MAEKEEAEGGLRPRSLTLTCAIDRRTRHGYRRWSRWICALVDHDPWYCATRRNWYGLTTAYIVSCWRCGKELDSFHAEAFEGNAP